MEIPIQMIYNYQAGNKTIDGYFPIYFPSASYIESQSQSAESNRELTKKLLNENDPVPILAPTSTEFDPVEFILKKDGIEYNLFKQL